MAKSFTSESLKADLLAGRIVTIPGIGKLRVIDKPARKSRNPRTGETIEVPAKRAVKFSASSIILGDLNSAA